MDTQLARRRPNVGRPPVSRPHLGRVQAAPRTRGIVGRLLFVAVLAFAVALPVGAQEMPGSMTPGGMTPSDVHQHARWVIAEIRAIREHEGVTETPRDPGTQLNKLPIHVYQKAVEVMGKVGRYQQSLGMEPMEVNALPFTALTPEVVNEPVDAILVNLRAVKDELGMTETVPQPEFIPGRNPTEVYELLWRASYMMDGLTEAIRPTDVYAKQRQAVADLTIVAQALDVSLPDERETFNGKEPRDVLMENYVNMYRLARIQRELGIEPFYVPPLPGGELTPANVFDTAGTLIGELHRIKAELGVERQTPPLQTVNGKTPDDVYAEAKFIQDGLDRLLQAASER